MYHQKKFISENFIEYEISHFGRYGAKGESRAEKKKATTELIKKQNQRNRINLIRRTLQKNFFPNDIWLTLKYAKNTRKTVKEVEADIKKFQNLMRKDYKMRGESFKWIKRIEIGKNGGLHAHFVINRIYGSEILIQKNWPGYVYYTNIREEGGMSALAEYIGKPLPPEVEQLSLFPEEEKRLLKYSTSRNLIRPEPEKKTFKRKTVRHLLQEQIKPSSQEFRVDPDSIVKGVNPVTGYSFIIYREIRIKPKEREIKPPEELKWSRFTSRQPSGIRSRRRLAL